MHLNRFKVLEKKEMKQKSNMINKKIWPVAL